MKFIELMTRNVAEEEVLNKGNKFNSFRYQISLGFNMIFSVLAAFGMAYYICLQMSIEDSRVRSYYYYIY
jgi:hypothetical protein